ncbi:MAG: hypothetical protein NC098_02280 [Lachnoclostridium sp.]|nr:hypothetical protein [Lachnoclostridium sp.]
MNILANMVSIKKTILALAVAGMTAVVADGQNFNSPYSMFGYGQLRENATATQRQMGGVGYAMHSGRNVNVMNPASYAATDTLTFLFDMGIDFTSFEQKDADGSHSDFGGGLDYITMQFPVAKGMGVSIGVVPYSSVGYAFGNEISNGQSSHQGTGGMNQLYAGFGIEPFKNFRVGFNVSYLFGNIYNDVYATTSAGNQSLFEQVMEVQDFHFNFGLQYTLNLSRKNELTLGLVYSPGKTLLGTTYVQQYDTQSDAAPSTVDEHSLKGNYSLPDTYGAGLAYRWNRSLLVEADFTYQPWSKAKFKGFDDFSGGKLDNRYRVGLGASFTPDERAGYFKRMTYRVGGYYNRDYIMVNDNHVKDYGLSCGLGFPAFQSKTMINIGFDWVKRQAYPQALLTENYYNITLAVTFNELWFFKNKIR